MDSEQYDILMFADDTKVSRKICNVNDGALLQQDLDSLMEWSKMSFGFQH